MTARHTDKERVEAAVERAETAEEKAAAARAKAEELAARALEEDRALAARAAGAVEPVTVVPNPSDGVQPDDGLQEVTLAHPLTDNDRRVHHLGNQDLSTGATIRVRPEVKQALVAAGYAMGIEPAPLAASRGLR